MSDRFVRLLLVEDDLEHVIQKLNEQLALLQKKRRTECSPLTK
ncbi:MAG: hypothetical protein O7G87_06685 [bacterium]|nr:hypothetical protein [bacterium]